LDNKVVVLTLSTCVRAWWVWCYRLFEWKEDVLDLKSKGLKKERGRRERETVREETRKGYW